MKQIGVGTKWRNWIKRCLQSAMVSILINGSSTQEFRMERGLRQGDLLSLFLFLIVTEALQVLTLEECHSDMSGILINNEKRILYGIGIDPREVESFSNILNCKNDVLPFVYVGLPVAMLGNLPLYYLALFQALIKVLHTLENIRRHFFWGFKDESKGDRGSNGKVCSQKRLREP
nr:hypothetical protein [Tanacetum cinerariifolium]